MQIREGFLQTKLGEQAYVLPFGQNIADRCEGISLNETGEILWRGTVRGCGKKELVDMLKQEYGLGDEMDAQLLQDVENFQKFLCHTGILEDRSVQEYGWNPLFFSAGPIKTAYKGPEKVFEDYFQKFSLDSDGGEADLTVQVACLPPVTHKNGRVILRNEELLLMDVGEEYLFLFMDFPVLREMQVKKDGSYALLYCDYGLIEKNAEDIFHAIRFAVLVAASEKGFFFLHSASFLYRGRAWLFSGKSGTGKSTHTNLWKEAFGVELLNGDLNMLGMEDGQLMVYGQPWCGTSGISTKENYPLGGITFLRQAQENICTEPQMSEKILAVVQRMISPTWNRKLMERNITFAESVVQYSHIWFLACTPDREAAEVMKRTVDHACQE